jgi:hypothetical protein
MFGNILKRSNKHNKAPNIECAVKAWIEEISRIATHNELETYYAKRNGEIQDLFRAPTHGNQILKRDTSAYQLFLDAILARAKELQVRSS